MKILLRFGVVLAVLCILRIALPLGVAWGHYRSTPGFREWVHEHPAGDDVWRSTVPAGTVLAREMPWRSSEGPPGDRRGQWAPVITVLHGDEVLLDLELDVSIESREVEDWSELDVPSEAFEALAVSVLRASLDPDFHAVAVLSVEGLSRYADGPPGVGLRQGPRLQLDVFALSGPGEVELIVQEVPEGGPGDAPSLLGDADLGEQRMPLLYMLLGIAFPTDDAPEEGLAYQVRTTFSPSWTRVEGGRSGGGMGAWKFAGTSRQYSAKLNGEQSVRSPFGQPGHFSSSTSAHVQAVYTWQDEVW